MKKTICLLAVIILAQVLCIRLWAQKTIISGTVKNSVTNEKVSSVSVTVKNKSEGTFSDDKGNFRLPVAGSFPIILMVSSVGFENLELTVINNSENPEVRLTPAAMLGQEVVVSATRTPTRFLESPVSVERLNIAAIRNAATPSFYESIANVKGVDLTTSSLTFRTVSTRGFNGSGNLRMNQFMDGMDNQAPGLNFSLGNLLGMSELDVESVELLPGASSALYGSGGLNGTLLMNSKNPFKYQGFSFQVKEGIMHVDKKQRDPSPYHDLSIRWAKAFNRFAFKINTQFIKAQDWQAKDVSNLARTNIVSKQIPGDRNSDINYDGVNVYGDEVNADMYATTQAIIYQVVERYKAAVIDGGGKEPTPDEIDRFMLNHPQYMVFWIAMKNGLIPKKRVSRSGYNEKDLVDYKTYNLKVSGGLYYNITSKTEASLIGYWGTGTTVYTGADRYSLKGVKMGQYKAEIKNKNWFLRGYTTQENAGEAYNTTALASYINESWKVSQQWFPEYIGNFAGARLKGATEANAHQLARSKADSGRLLPGTPGFNEQYEKIRKVPISKKGALFLDKTDLWQFDGQLNLSSKIKVVDVLIGGDYKQYILNSEGTLFADTAGRIKISEWGAFLQLQKDLFHSRLKLTASGRYDKSKNFEGRFTPRVTALIKVTDNNNIRMSYQSGYRFPTTQDQYINLFTGTTTLIGSLPEFADYYNFKGNPVYTAQSIAKYRETTNLSDLQKGQFSKLESEKVNSLEFGYKGLLAKKLLIDLYIYFSKYNDFIGRVAVGQPRSAATVTDLLSSFTTKSFAYAQNVNQDVKARGFGLGLEYSVIKGYTANLHVSSDKIFNVPAEYISFFNTPAYRFNIGLANEHAWKQFGFNLNYRWQDKVDWEGTFGTGSVPAYGTLDAQISYRINGTKNMFKIGASNLLNKYYYSAFGNPQVGGLFYVSFGYNIL
ncbi:MAG: TonB-dependent receptor [Chitinophagaceae bacterium]